MPVLILANEATAARRRVYFHCVDATDGITPETGEAGGQPQISTNGGAFTNTGIGTLTHLGNGRYYADLTQAAVATAGDSIETRYKSANTAETPGDSVRVVAFDPYNADSLGVGRIDATVSSRASQTSVDTIDDFLDTEVAAIKAKTDQLTFTNAGVVNAAVYKWLGADVSAAVGGTVPSNVVAWNNSAVATPEFAGYPEVNASLVGGEAALATGDIDFDLLANLDAAITSRLSPYLHAGTAQSGTTTTAVLAATASSVDDIYNGLRLWILGGTGAGQTAVVTDYVGSTRTATFAALGTAPDNTSVIGIQGPVAVGDKTGFSLASTGLDAISTTAPSGVASNFREMLVQLWRRHFKKTTLTSTQLRTYADDGNTVVTTQAVSDSSGTETVGAAS